MKVIDESKEMARMYVAALEEIFDISLKVPNIAESTAEIKSMSFRLIDRYDFGEINEALFDSKKACGLNIALIE